MERQRLTRAVAVGGLYAETFLHQDALALPGIEATVLPTFPLRGGKPTFLGANLFLEGEISGMTGREWGLAYGVHPGWVGAVENYQSLLGRFFLQEGYVKVGYRRAELLYGKLQSKFGDAKHGNLLLSGANLPVTQFRFTLRPHRLPSPFSFLGPTTFDTWVGNQEATTGPAGARLWSVSIASKPFSWLEFGITELFNFGGSGRSDLELGELAATLFYVGSASLDLKRHRMMVWNLGVWWFQKRMKSYFQFGFENLGDTPDLLVGVWFPTISTNGMDLRLEYVRTAPSAYRSTLWPQGFTNAGGTLGHPLGPDAEGVYLDLGLPIDLWRPGLLFSVEARNLNRYSNTETEKRFAFGAELSRRFEKWEVFGAMRYTYATNFQFQAARATSVFVGTGGVRYSFF